MITRHCDACDEIVPTARHCEACGEPLPTDAVPSLEAYRPEFTARMSDAALDATHESVSFDVLRSAHDGYGRPLGGYLVATERPEILCELSSVRIDDEASYTAELTSGFLTSGHLVVTDERLVAVLPNTDETQVFGLEMADVVDITSESGLLSTSLVVSVAGGFSVTYDVDAGNALLADLTATARRMASRHDSAASQTAKFRRAVDGEIAVAEDAETALRNVADLFAERDGVTAVDHAVADADSLDEVLDAAVDFTRDDASEPSSLPAPEDDAETTRPTLRERPTPAVIRTRVAETLQSADPREVGKYTMAATVGLGAYAISAPFSTTLGLAALATGGTATGLYASANPQSVVARIDPMALVMNVNRRGRSVRDGPVAATANVGRALGAVEYLGGLEYDSAYAQWLVEADIDSVIDGAEMAQRRAARNAALGEPGEASLLGAIGGLAYGYTDGENDVSALFDGDSTVSELSGAEEVADEETNASGDHS